MLRIAAVLVAGASALQAPRLSSAPAWLNAATLEQPPATSKDLLPRERYVASNRFKTRGGKAAAKFEARWANRKSRLAELEGFRYFSLFREVPVEDVVGPRGAAAMGGAAVVPLCADARAIRAMIQARHRAVIFGTVC